MTKYLVSAIIILGLLFASSVMIIRKQSVVNGEQRQAIKEHEVALRHAKELKNAAEAAVGVRDQNLIQIKNQTRSLQNALKEAIANNDCARQPIPPELDKLLRDRAPKARESVRPKHALGTAPIT